MTASFGIYLGNSTCCVAVNRSGNIDVVANPGGERVTPAVVAFTENEVITGAPAKQGIIRHASGSVLAILRTLGADSIDDIVFPLNHKCQIVFENEKPKYSIQVGEKTKLIPVEDALKHIMLMLKDIASSHSSEEELPAVITLPSWANEYAISCVQEAANAAGFSVLSVILQPSSLTLAYDLLTDNKQSINVLTLHCGGSSVVASLAEISGGLLTIRESSSPSPIAGDSLTLVLVDYFAKEFYMRYKGDPLENRRSKRKLYNASENCKHVLSTMNTAQVHVESLWEGVDFSAHLSRARFDGLALSTLNEFFLPAKELLERCGISYDQISKVILSGGSCKIPKLQQMISETFPQAEVLKKFSPDEVLAMGAATEASFYSQNGYRHCATPSRLIASLSVPIYAMIQESKDSHCIFTRGTPTHARSSVMFECLEYPSTLIIYEGHSPSKDPSDGQILSQIELSFDGEYSKHLQADFSIKSDGSLKVKLEEPISKAIKTFIIEADR